MDFSILLIGLGIVILLFVIGKIFSILTKIFFIIILVAAIAVGFFFWQNSNNNQTTQPKTSISTYFINNWFNFSCSWIRQYILVSHRQFLHLGQMVQVAGLSSFGLAFWWAAQMHQEPKFFCKFRPKTSEY